MQADPALSRRQPSTNGRRVRSLETIIDQADDDQARHRSADDRLSASEPPAGELRSHTSKGAFTRLLRRCREGDELAFEQLVTLVYDDLVHIAHQQLQRYRPAQTLNTVALVHETYLRLIDQPKGSWQERAYFFGMVSRIMRQIIVDYARMIYAKKRKGGVRHVPLDNEIEASSLVRHAETALLINTALERLAELDGRLVGVVECRYFAGFTEQETANALGVSIRTVQRDWRRAKAWLREEVGQRA